MSKAQDLLKRIDPVVATIKLIVNLAAFVAIILPCLYWIVNHQIEPVYLIVKQEIEPIALYFQMDVARIIEKNEAKIKKDPEDVKIEDIEWALNWWPYLEKSDILNKQTLKQKVEILKDWYKGNKT